MRSPGPCLLAVACLLSPAFARHEVSICGTHGETSGERLFLHRQGVRSRLRSAALPAGLPAVNRDFGDIAVIEDTDGVVERQNEFNLDLKSLTFTPAGAGRYRYSVSELGYDAAAASSGVPLAALDDDDSRSVPLPFT